MKLGPPHVGCYKARIDTADISQDCNRLRHHTDSHCAGSAVQWLCESELRLERTHRGGDAITRVRCYSAHPADRGATLRASKVRANVSHGDIDQGGGR